MDGFLKSPLVHHALFGFAYTMLIGTLIFRMHQPHPGIIAAVIVGAFFYGREAGQREHDLKHGTPPWSATKALLGAEFLFGWAWSNLQDWLAAVGGTLVALVILAALFGL